MKSGRFSLIKMAVLGVALGGFAGACVAADEAGIVVYNAQHA